MLIPVLLAGGEGKRLWPLSNKKTPKQFLSISPDGASFYQDTVRRILQCTAAKQCITIASKRHAPAINQHFQPYEDTCKHHVILEPSARNTAAAALLAAHYAQQNFGDAIVWISPTDHVVRNVSALQSAVEKAIPLARDGAIVTFGIPPSHIDSNYGYILTQHTSNTADASNVELFMEKPPLEAIQAIDPRYHIHWNSGMFIASASTLLGEAKRIMPKLQKYVTHAYRRGIKHFPYLELMPQDYMDMPALSLDKALMEHSRKLKVIPVDMGWMDIGSWQSLWEYSQMHNNHTENQPGNCSNCLSYLNKRFILANF